MTNINSDEYHPFVIVTGGPGGGKTALIEALKRRGFTCIDEVARTIIQEEVVQNGDALPWENREKFLRKMFDGSVSSYHSQVSDDIVFFDRGIIDSLAYAKCIGVEVSEEMRVKAGELRFNKHVFVTPPWKEIFSTDQERKQTFEEAIETYEQIVKIYQEYGYQTVVLPIADVEQRVDFILKYLKF